MRQDNTEQKYAFTEVDHEMGSGGKTDTPLELDNKLTLLAGDTGLNVPKNITVPGGGIEANPAYYNNYYDAKNPLVENQNIAGAGGAGEAGPAEGFANSNNGAGALVGATKGGCPSGTFQAGPNPTNCEAIPVQFKVGATARITDAANKSLPKENARLVKQVLGGLAGLTSAACVVTAYLAAEKARKEKSLLNKVLTGAAAAGTAAAAVEIGVQTYDLFMNKEQPKLGASTDTDAT